MKFAAVLKQKSQTIRAANRYTSSGKEEQKFINSNKEYHRKCQ